MTIRRKRCYACHREKRLKYFCLNKNSKDGHGWACKKCMAKYAKHRIETVPGLKERISAYVKDRYKNNPAYRNYVRMYMLNRYHGDEEYKKATKARARLWVVLNPGKMREAIKKQEVKWKFYRALLREISDLGIDVPQNVRQSMIPEICRRSVWN